MDVASDADVVRLVARAREAYGRLDVMLCNAGFGYYGSTDDTPPEVMRRMMDVNFMGTFYATRAALPIFREQRRGHLILVSSIVGRRGIPNMSGYSATKAAIIGLTKSIAVDFVAKGIRCNAVCPGTVDTPSLGDRIAAAADPAQARRDFIARQPMGRLGRAEEVADLCVYLASDESRFMTGQAVIIDGGIAL